MKLINPDYKRLVSGKANQSPYFHLMSMTLVNFDFGESLLEIDLQLKHLQPFGVVHGGVFATIIDAAAYWAVFAEVDENVGMTSVDLKLNYLAPAITGKLIARGKRIKVGRTLGLGEAEVLDQDGKILAHGTSTLMILPSVKFADDSEHPPKYLEVCDCKL